MLTSAATRRSDRASSAKAKSLRLWAGNLYLVRLCDDGDKASRNAERSAMIMKNILTLTVWLDHVAWAWACVDSKRKRLLPFYAGDWATSQAS